MFLHSCFEMEFRPKLGLPGDRVPLSPARSRPSGQTTSAMEMLSLCALSYCRSGKSERAACRSVLTLCKWLLADWKDLTPQLKQAVKKNAGSPSLSPLSKNIAALLELPVEDQATQRITAETTGIKHNCGVTATLRTNVCYT